MLSEIRDAARELSGVKICGSCFNTHIDSGNSCNICASPERDKNFIAIVEKPTDLMTIEKTKKFNGIYLVLGNLTKNAVMDPEQKLRLGSLKKTIAKNSGQAEEIILAINPTAYGDLNAAMLQKELQGHTKKLSRLGRGIPTGGEIEFADEETLGAALERRS